MADWKFEGFARPQEGNWFKLPNVITDNLPKFSSRAEIVIVIYVAMYTFDAPDSRPVTMDDLMNGYKREDETRMDSGVKMTLLTLASGIERAKAHGFIVAEIDSSGVETYRFSMSESEQQAQ